MSFFNGRRQVLFLCKCAMLTNNNYFYIVSDGCGWLLWRQNAVRALIRVNKLLASWLQQPSRNMTSADEMASSLPMTGIAIERADSEYECELMIEALKKELSAVRVRRWFCR